MINVPSPSKDEITLSSELSALLGKIIVLDVKSFYVFLGELSGGDHRYLILKNADVHDLRDTSTTRERYVLDAKLHGINSNRKQVFVSRDEIVSLSLLEDVVH